MQTTPSTQQLADLGAVALWDFNQASTATALTDLVGTANQTAISGTSVVTTDDPTGWTFGLSGGGGGGSAGGGGSVARPGRHRGRFPARGPAWF